MKMVDGSWKKFTSDWDKPCFYEYVGFQFILMKYSLENWRTPADTTSTVLKGIPRLPTTVCTLSNSACLQKINYSAMDKTLYSRDMAATPRRAAR